MLYPFSVISLLEKSQINYLMANTSSIFSFVNRNNLHTYIWICVCMYAYLYAYIFMCMHMYIMYAYEALWVYAYEKLYLCIYFHICVYIFLFKSASTLVSRLSNKFSAFWGINLFEDSHEYNLTMSVTVSIYYLYIYLHYRQKVWGYHAIL